MVEITSPLSGKIIEVNITAGQTVTQDDEIFIIEAMKMENAIYGEAGTVKEVKVAVGSMVEENEVLAVIE